MYTAARGRAMTLLLAGISACAILISHAAGQPPAEVSGFVTELDVAGRFDQDRDGRLDSAERHAAMTYLDANPQLRKKGRAPVGGPKPPPPPGLRLAPGDVKTYPPSVPLFDPGALRTLFLEFEDADWEKQLAVFHRTDVLVPARLVVDGKEYPGVGVHFRGENSFFMVTEGWKRSLGLDLDFVHGDQRLCGYRGIHLLNFHEDPSFLRSILFMEIARHYFAAPRANFMRVVINGESWGVYVNQQKFDKDFLRDHFHTTKGARFRSPGRSRKANLSYLGDDIAAYKEQYSLRSKDNPRAWADLMHLCKVIDQTPPERLAAALEPILDLDGTLAWLALDNVVDNDDSYWHDGNDYALYQDPGRRFHLVPHDVNEAFRPVKVRGGGDGLRVDPLANMTNKDRPLLKLLAVPELRARYLRYVRDMAENWLDWAKLGPIVERYRALIAADVASDTHKHFSTQEFAAGIDGARDDSPPAATTLRGFCEQRRAYLLSHPAIRGLDR